MNVRVLGVLCALVLVGCDGGETGGPDRTDGILALTGNPTGGETVYQNNCAVCHAADGSGGTGADLTAHVPGHSDEEIVTTVLEGGEGMASFDNLSDQAIADLLAYLRQEHG